MEYKCGATRNVWLIDKYAIKIPRARSWRTFLNGLLANLTEREFSTMHSPMLADVKYSDPIGLVLIMERADRVLKYTTKSSNEFFRCCEAAGLPTDWNPWNIGVFGRQWKLIDFGTKQA